MSRVKILVVMPVYNAEATVARAALSVANQTLDPNLFQLLVVNNNSSDRSMDVLAETLEKAVPEFSRRWAVMDCKTPGIVPALNSALLGAGMNYKYIARMDADDVWYPTKLEKQLAFLEANPDVHILGTQISRCDPVTGNPLGAQARYPTSDAQIKERMFLGDNAICHPSVVFRSEILRVTGVYDSTYPVAEDLHLWLKAAKFFNFANLDETLVQYSVSHNPRYNPLTPQMCAIAMRQAYQRLHAK